MLKISWNNSGTWIVLIIYVYLHKTSIIINNNNNKSFKTYHYNHHLVGSKIVIKTHAN